MRQITGACILLIVWIWTVPSWRYGFGNVCPRCWHCFERVTEQLGHSLATGHSPLRLDLENSSLVLLPSCWTLCFPSQQVLNEPHPKLPLLWTVLLQPARHSCLLHYNSPFAPCAFSTKIDWWVFSPLSHICQPLCHSPEKSDEDSYPIWSAYAWRTWAMFLFTRDRGGC